MANADAKGRATRRQFYPENVAVLCLAICMVALAMAFPESGRILRLGGTIGLAAFFIIKGVSRLQCHASDVALTAVTFALVLASKIVPPRIISPLAFEVSGLLLLPIFCLTGLSFKAVAAGQKGKES